MTPLRFAITSPHLDVKRTFTSKLSIMHGVQLLLPPGRAGGSPSAFRNLLKNVQSHTRHEIKSRYKARSAIGGISMMVLVSRFLPYSGTRRCFSTSS